MVSSRSQGYARPQAGLAAQLHINSKFKTDQIQNLKSTCSHAWDAWTKNEEESNGMGVRTEADEEDLRREDDAAGDWEVHHADGVDGLGEHAVDVAEDDGAQAPQRPVVHRRRAVEEHAQPVAALALRRRRVRLAPRQERRARHQPRQRRHAVRRRRRRPAAVAWLLQAWEPGQRRGCSCPAAAARRGSG